VIIKSNPVSFEAIVNEYTDYVYNIAYRILGHAEDARDAVQETFIKLHRNLGKYDEKQGLKNWICTIALNASRDIYRSRKRGGVKVSLENFDVPDRSDESHDTEQKLHVEKILDRLPPDFRAIMLLFYMEEKSIKEIAAMLSIPAVLAKVRLYRARRSALKIMKDIQ
jgi:RNA polymerase sigma-70 factor (ECF subfamily)